MSERRAPTAEQLKLAEMILTAGSGGSAVLSGAGISVPSGIPDFRSPGTGRWADTKAEAAAHITMFHGDPERFWGFYRERLDVADGIEPNPAHRAVSELERRGWLLGLITQNIDGLHQKAGSADPIEIHGSIRTLSCIGCGHQVSREEALDELFAADGVPYCPRCSRPLKPGVTLFGENLPETASARALSVAQSAKLLICIGTSLVVQPVASLPDITAKRGGRVALVTSGWTPFDQSPDLAVKLSGDVATEMSGVIAALDELEAGA